MQLTIDVDKNFIENLKKEFHTSNTKEALYKLFDFYKQKNIHHSNIDTEIEKRIADYKDGSLEINEFHNGLDEIRQNILKKI